MANKSRYFTCTLWKLTLVSREHLYSNCGQTVTCIYINVILTFKSKPVCVCNPTWALSVHIFTRNSFSHYQKMYNWKSRFGWTWPTVSFPGRFESWTALRIPGLCCDEDEEWSELNEDFVATQLRSPTVTSVVDGDLLSCMRGIFKELNQLWAWSSANLKTLMDHASRDSTLSIGEGKLKKL